MPCDGGGFFKRPRSLVPWHFMVAGIWLWLCMQVLVKKRGKMEANFSLTMDGQMPAFRELILSNRLMNIFRVDGEESWKALRLMVREEFMVTICRPRTNLDISSLFVALALLVGMSMEEVLWVAALVLRPKWAEGLNDVVA